VSDGFEGILCPLCGTEALGKENDALVRCSSCGAPFEAAGGVPVLARNWHRLRAEIEEARRVNPLWYQDVQLPEDSSPWRHHLRKRRSYVESALVRHLGHGNKAPRLLDLGCGDGTNLAWLARFAERIYGSDYNPVRLARAKALNPGATLFLADILDYPAKSDFFDVIFFNHVVEHIPDDIAALQAVRRILRPGGLLILGTPNEGAWWWQWAYRRDPASLLTTDHRHFYTAPTIGSKMIKAGFELKETRHLGWGPPDWALDARIRRYKLVDDLFSVIGRAFLPHQASSLYLLATKNKPE
jgi:SAM-dependent methyltransferase